MSPEAAWTIPAPAFSHCVMSPALPPPAPKNGPTNDGQRGLNPFHALEPLNEIPKLLQTDTQHRFHCNHTCAYRIFRSSTANKSQQEWPESSTKSQEKLQAALTSPGVS